MFLELDKKTASKRAIIDNTGSEVSYGNIVEFCHDFYGAVDHRTLIFIKCRNSVGAALGYLGSINNGIVPLLVSSGMDPELYDNLVKTYSPEYIWEPADESDGNEEHLYDAYGYTLVSTGNECHRMNDDLALLLPTSGSTGSPKLVRHSYGNLNAQAEHISQFFGIKADDRALVDLPIYFTMGLSVLTSFLYAGATCCLTTYTVLDPEYWTFWKENKVTVFTNIPYTYEMLARLRFFRMDLPDLRIITQGGGKLKDELFIRCAEYAADTGRQFIPTYGQTEGTARMAYLPPEYALDKIGSIGKAIPGGKLYLIDETEAVIDEPDTIGEMIYEGPNVTLGYAECTEDLMLGDERDGILPTGDLARKDKDGFFYIVGRKKRFLKLTGLRIGMDECERIVQNRYGISCACTGSDAGMVIYVEGECDTGEIRQYISEKIHVNASLIEVRQIDVIPRNEAGKIMYSLI